MLAQKWVRDLTIRPTLSTKWGEAPRECEVWEECGSTKCGKLRIPGFDPDIIISEEEIKTAKTKGMKKGTNYSGLLNLTCKGKGYGNEKDYLKDTGFLNGIDAYHGNKLRDGRDCPGRGDG